MNELINFYESVLDELSEIEMIEEISGFNKDPLYHLVQNIKKYKTNNTVLRANEGLIWEVHNLLNDCHLVLKHQNEKLLDDYGHLNSKLFSLRIDLLSFRDSLDQWASESLKTRYEDKINIMEPILIEYYIINALQLQIRDLHKVRSIKVRTI